MVYILIIICFFNISISYYCNNNISNINNWYSNNSNISYCCNNNINNISYCFNSNIKYCCNNSCCGFFSISCIFLISCRRFLWLFFFL